MSLHNNSGAGTKLFPAEKSSAHYHHMKKLTLLPAAFLCILFLAACKFNPNVQGSGASLLQGIWTEQTQPYQDSLLQYTRSDFTFTCDSFYVELTTHARVNYYDKSCFNNGVWKEYAKGNYVLSNDTLYLIGVFTKQNYKQKLDGCYRVGQYIPRYRVINKKERSLTLQNIDEGYPVSLILKQKLICNPKSL